MSEQSKFSGHAVVEVMGHQQHAGFVTTEAFGSEMRQMGFHALAKWLTQQANAALRAVGALEAE